MKNEETLPEVVSKVVQPYARLIMKMLRIDQSRPSALFRQRFADWLTSSDAETVVSTIDNALQTMYPLHVKIIRLRAGFDGEPIPTIASLAKEYQLSHGRIQQLASMRTLRRHILDQLPKPVADKAPECISQLSNQPSFADAAVRIDSMEISVRTENALKDAGIETIGDLVRRTAKELLKHKRFGRKYLKEARELLASLGLRLRE